MSLKKSNPFKYSADNKRYHTLYYYNMQKYGKRVYKAPIDAGFTCPNIDGRSGIGGCIYCDSGSGYFTERGGLNTSEQFDIQEKKIHEKHPDALINAYFQSYTNTYAKASVIRERIEPVLHNPFLAGISIATRADCLEHDALKYLTKLNEETNLTVELGLQTIHDTTAKLINRCHDFEQFMKGFSLLHERNIRTVIHIINGLPGETREMMLETSKKVGELCPEGLKIHLLHVIKGTALEKMYLQGDYSPLEKDEYVDIVVNQLEQIPAETVIERLTGDGDKQKLIAPLWSVKKMAVLGAIDRLQVQLDSYQGKT